MKKSPEQRLRDVHIGLDPYLQELASIERAYPRRSIAAMNVGQASEQLRWAMAWTIEGLKHVPEHPAEPAPQCRE